MAREYLDKSGLSYFWSKIKALIDSRISNMYYKSGDSLPNTRFCGASFLTSSSTLISVTFPLGKYVTATGFNATLCQLCTRQNGKYTHGCTATNFVDWTVSDVEITNGVMRLDLTRTTTTNAVNNAPIGINMWLAGTFT